MRPKAPLSRTEILGAVPLLAALGDETRLRLLVQLASEGPGSSAHLTSKAPVSRQAITKHLNVLATAGLLTSERDGRQRVWSIDTKRITHVRKLLKQLSLGWEEMSTRKAVTEPA